jgi:hypothetical protein
MRREQRLEQLVLDGRHFRFVNLVGVKDLSVRFERRVERRVEEALPVFARLLDSSGRSSARNWMAHASFHLGRFAEAVAPRAAPERGVFPLEAAADTPQHRDRGMPTAGYSGNVSGIGGIERVTSRHRNLCGSTTMTSNRFLSTLGAALLATCCMGSAQAADINLTGWAFGSGQSVNVSVPTYNGSAGGFAGQLSNAGIFNNANFITYCVELTESFSLPGNLTGYSIVSGASYGHWNNQNATGQTSAQVATKIAKLMTYAYSNPTFVDSSLESGSMQLAIWNAIYDNDTTLDTYAGAKFSNTSGVAGLNAGANSLLSNSASVNSQYNVFVLTKAGSQDFLLLQRVPTPASLALAGLALALLWQTRRRAAARN